jgi:hypothetical protein
MMAHELKFASLAAVAAVAIVAVAFEPLRDLALARENASAAKPFEPRADPSPGTHIALPSTDVYGRRVKLSPRSLLIAIGPCSSCSARRVDYDWLITVKGYQVLMLVENSPEEVREYSEPLPKALYWLADASGRVSHALNIEFFAPGAFELDSHSRIVACQEFGRSVGEMIRKGT